MCIIYYTTEIFFQSNSTYYPLFLESSTCEQKPSSDFKSILECLCMAEQLYWEKWFRLADKRGMLSILTFCFT